MIRLSIKSLIKISNITDLLLNKDEKELEMIFKLLQDLTNILEELDIDK
ncbi:MAG: hypothetical protein ACOCW0_02425 [Halanaerobium sp.]